MNALVLGLLLVFGDPLGAAAHPQDPPEAPELELAARAYRDGRFAEARLLFQQVLARPGIPRGPVLYNLGNCAFRLGDQVEALFHYRRALLRMPGDPKLAFNLQLTRRQLGTDTSRSALSDSLQVRWMDPATLLALATSLQSLGLAGLWFLRRPGARRAMVALIALGLIAAGRLVQSQWLRGPLEGLVLAAEVGVRPEPHAEIPATSRLEAGARVRVIEMSERWARIVHAGGEGWTERSRIGVIE